MRNCFAIWLACLATASSTQGFQLPAVARPATSLQSDYLSFLADAYASGASTNNGEPNGVPIGNGYTAAPSIQTPSAPAVSNGANPPVGALTLANHVEKTFLHATLDYFAISNLTPKGPRAGADVGQPHDATLKLGEDGNIRSGSWWCAAGGWPSLKQRATTEIFFVISGHGCLTDLDGTRHYFGAGDTVVLPKGWSGRWDVLEDIHKVWFVHDHPQIEEDASQTIRARVANYHTYSPQFMESSIPGGDPRLDALHGSPKTTSKVIYDVGSTEVGVWTCTAGSFPVVHRPNTECFIVLEGVFFLTNASNGEARRCGPGDTVILPKGWSGYWDIIEPVKKLWVTV